MEIGESKQEGMKQLKVSLQKDVPGIRGLKEKEEVVSPKPGARLTC